MFQQLVLFTRSGTLNLNLGKDVIITLQLNEHEQDLLRSMCERFYGERQSYIADCVANAQPQLADFSEVEPE